MRERCSSLNQVPGAAARCCEVENAAKKIDGSSSKGRVREEK